MYDILVRENLTPVTRSFEAQAPAIARKARAGQFARVDGSKFDGHQVDWDLLLACQRIYLEEEKQALARWLRERRALQSRDTDTNGVDE